MIIKPKNKKMEKQYKGYNGFLTLTDTGVIIKRGARGFFLGGGFLRGEKTIPYSSIVAVQLRKAGLLTFGYIQLTLFGGSECKAGLFQSVKDENSITFQDWSNSEFAEAKERIEEMITRGKNINSGLDDLEKLAELKDKGIVSEEEFNAKKKQILKL